MAERFFRGFPDETVADAASWRGGYVSIGNFDGVHRGHQRLIKTLKTRADQAGVPTVVLTFDPHPITILRPGETPPRLSTITRKAELLHHYGVDCVIAYPTDRELLKLSPEEFFQQIILDQFHARGMVEGPNFFFGRNRAGTIETLKQFCNEHQLTLDIVEPLSEAESETDSVFVSSSLIRQSVLAGEIQRATELLGHPYQIEGVVSAGAQRGRTLGFPTANLEQIETLLPPAGVYAAVAHLQVEGETKRFAAAINLGTNPTFDDHRQKLEAHLLNFSGDLLRADIEAGFS